MGLVLWGLASLITAYIYKSASEESSGPNDEEKWREELSVEAAIHPIWFWFHQYPMSLIYRNFNEKYIYKSHNNLEKIIS